MARPQAPRRAGDHAGIAEDGVEESSVEEGNEQ